MNLGEIKNRVQVSAGDEAGIFIESEDITSWVNDAQVEINRITEIVRGVSLISSIANQQLYPVPADFIHEKYVTYNSRKLQYTMPELIVDPYASTGEPSCYWIDARSLGLYPTPASSISNAINLNYTKIPARLVSDTDIPEIPEYMHPEIVRLAFAKAKEKDEDFEAAMQIETDVYARLAVIFDIAKHGSGSSYPAIREV